MSTATSFVCPECQRVLRTPNAVPPGKKIRCPACNTIFAPAAEATRPASPIRTKESAVPPPPAPSSRRAPVDDEDDYPRRPLRRAAADEDEWDDRPRRRPKKRSALPFIIGGSVALLLLVGVVVGGFIWPGFFLGGGAGLGGRPSENTAALLNFMPADPMAIGGADLARLQKRNKLDDLLLKVPEQVSTQVPEMPAGVRSLFKDIDAFVFAMDQPESEVFAVRTKSAFKTEDVLRDAKAQERTVQGKKFYRIPGRFGRDIHAMLDPATKTVVISRLPEEAFANLLNNAKGPTGQCRTLVDKVSGSPLWGVAQMKGAFKMGFDQGMQQMGILAMMNPKGQQILTALRGIKGIVMWVNSADSITVNFGGDFASAADATRIRNDFNEGWNDQAKQQARAVVPMAGAGAPPEARNAITLLVNDIIDSFKADSDGTLAWLSLTFSNKTSAELARVAEEQMAKGFANLAGGGFGGGPAAPPFGKAPAPPVAPPFGKGGFKAPPMDFPDFNDQRFRVPALAAGVGNVVLQRNDKLTNADPPCPRKPGGNQKLYTVRMTAGKVYQMDLVSTGPGRFGGNWDNFLYFEDDKGKLLWQDDDGGGFPNARIVFRCDRTADYRVIVTALGAGDGGPFTLTVREQ